MKNEPENVSLNSVRARAGRFVSRLFDVDPDSLELALQPLHGGVDCAGVVRIRVRFRDEAGRMRSEHLVAKHVLKHGVREAAVHTELLAGLSEPVSPRLLGLEQVTPELACMYLEWLPAARRWPWKNFTTSVRAIERLAHVHGMLAPARYRAAPPLGGWDYEAELRLSAESTLEALQDCRGHEIEAAIRKGLPALRRLVTSLALIRTGLAAADSAVVLHGDAHPGNAVVRMLGGSEQVLFLDWSRSRLGSPLEDVSSWLQSLGYWEPEVRRTHDTLLKRYLAARGLESKITAGLRGCYWSAAACTGLAGAIRYHYLVSRDPRRTRRERVQSVPALADWLRVVRRADAWCSA